MSFLTASWKKLCFVNYAIDPAILEPYVPAHTELDFFEGKCYVSLVGFLFDDVKLKGITIPFHKRFEEINLRFYVKHFDGSQWKRGTVFISEIVEKPAIAWVANTLYNEKYSVHKMHYKHDLTEEENFISYGLDLEEAGNMKYDIRYGMLIKSLTTKSFSTLQNSMEMIFKT